MNFDGSMIESKSGSGWVIRDSNGIIKLSAFRHLAKTSIIVTEHITLRDGILVAKFQHEGRITFQRVEKWI